MEPIVEPQTLTEKEIWSLISNDTPRQWEVFVNGNWWTRAYAANARFMIDQTAAWLVEERHNYGYDSGTEEVSIEVRCLATDERVRMKRELQL